MTVTVRSPTMCRLPQAHIKARYILEACSLRGSLSYGWANSTALVDRALPHATPRRVWMSLWVNAGRMHAWRRPIRLSSGGASLQRGAPRPGANRSRRRVLDLLPQRIHRDAALAPVLDALPRTGEGLGQVERALLQLTHLRVQPPAQAVEKRAG
eukprot:scaffold96202_cov63-Phaeocystis_antarctica.AAC.1